MSLFSYSAVNERKERIQGLVDAVSLQAGRNALQESGLFIEEIHEATPIEREGVKPWETVVVPEVEQDVPSSLPVNEPDTTQDKPMNQSTSPVEPVALYVPLLDTLHLYAGWLLAWYILVIALGAYQETKNLPFTIPFVEGLWQSVLILRAAFGIFLFLMFTSLYRFFGNRGWLGGILGVFGALLFYVFLVNT